MKKKVLSKSILTTMLLFTAVTVYAQERKALTVPDDATYPSANKVWRDATGSTLDEICIGEATNATDQDARDRVSPIYKQGNPEQAGVIKSEEYEGKVFYIFNKKYGKFLACGGKYGQAPILSETGSRYWVEKRDFDDENGQKVTRYFFHTEQQQPTTNGSQSGEFLGMTQRQGSNRQPLRDLVNDKSAFPRSSGYNGSNVWNAGSTNGLLYPDGGTAAWAVTPVSGSTDNLYTMSLRYKHEDYTENYVDFHMAPSEEYDGEEEVTLWREKTLGSWQTDKQYLQNNYSGNNAYTDPTATAQWVEGADEWKFITVKDYHDQFIMQAQTAQLTGAAVTMNAAYMVRDAHFDRNNKYDQAWTWYHTPESTGEGFNAGNTYYDNIPGELKARSIITSSAIQNKNAEYSPITTGPWTQQTAVSTDNDFNQTAHIGVGQNSQSEFVKYDGTNNTSVQGQYGKYYHFRGNAKTRLAQTTTVEVTGTYEFKVKALYVANNDNAKEDLSKSFLFVTRKSEGGVVQTVTSRDTKNNNNEDITPQEVQGGKVTELSTILTTPEEQNLAHDYSYYAIGKALRDDDNGTYDLSVKVYLMKGDKVTFGVHLGEDTSLDENGLPVDETITDWKRNENFVALDNFRIYYQGEKQMYLGEEMTSYDYLERDAENYQNAKVILHRSFNNSKYNTIVLPFSLSSNQLKDAFGSDVTLWKFSGPQAPGSTYVNFTKEDIDAENYKTTALMPYLIYVSKAPNTAPLQVLIPNAAGKVSQRINLGDDTPEKITGVEEVSGGAETSTFVGGSYKGYYEIPGVTFVKPVGRDLTKLGGDSDNNNPTSDKDGNASTLKFYGTLLSSTDGNDKRAQANDYVMSNGQFVLATNGAALQGYRCWIGATKANQEQGAKPLFLTIEEVMGINGTTPTDISKETISFSVDPTVPVYNTNGQYVGTMPISNIQKLPMGVYVANKHKIVVK